jgi:hypothetical protein
MDADPSLVMDESRSDELEAMWNEAWRTTSWEIDLKTGEIKKGSIEGPLPRDSASH